MPPRHNTKDNEHNNKGALLERGFISSRINISCSFEKLVHIDTSLAQPHFLHHIAARTHLASITDLTIAYLRDTYFDRLAPAPASFSSPWFTSLPQLRLQHRLSSSLANRLLLVAYLKRFSCSSVKLRHPGPYCAGDHHRQQRLHNHNELCLQVTKISISQSNVSIWLAPFIGRPLTQLVLNSFTQQSP